MKAIIFAGGAGTRLWPLSRKNSPKQFEKVIGDKSTLNLSIDRLLPDFSWNDIYISTNSKYVNLVKKELSHLPAENIIGEPEARDVGPAVGLVLSLLSAKDVNQPIVILWSDHVIKNVTNFKKILNTCQEYISQSPDHLIFISQKPRYASQNLGWIKFDKVLFRKNGINFHSFSGFSYRPSLEQAHEFKSQGNYAWNTGYFVTTVSFLWSLYKKIQPEMFKLMEELKASADKKDFPEILKKIYVKFPKISFDNAILEHLDKEKALVIPSDLGWSDVGAWEALKEALQTSDDKNVVKGKVVVTDCRDSLVYNYTDQLLVTIDLDGYLVVNTHDVVLVCHKNSVPKIKKLVESLSNSDNSHLT